MTPIKPGTAKRLGLRKPSGEYVYRDGAIRDEIRLMRWDDTPEGEQVIRENIKRFASLAGFSVQEWQVDWMSKLAPRNRP